MAAFLSEATEVHVPYLETAVFSEWARKMFCRPTEDSRWYVEQNSVRLCYNHAATSFYFVDDDPRWKYHEYHMGKLFQSPAEFLAHQSPFAFEVLAIARMQKHGPPWRRRDWENEWIVYSHVCRCLCPTDHLLGATFADEGGN
ncbi:unnamed protein product [Polarella glacialis]|uniref:Uncharacterized protein n=1 Tax=Polarella glacialis TaxID=89957 RepID=A0A813EDT8_POLGL|nr:unnamed protein product [Polarella glacialis]